MTVIEIIFYILSPLTLIAAALPLIKNDHWVFRVFEYPRFQIFLLSLSELIIFTIFCDYSNPIDITVVALLTITSISLGSVIYPYTRLAPRQMKSIIKGALKKEDTLRLMVANVYQFNRQSQNLLDEISAVDPDILLLLETDQWWNQAVASLQEKYPEHLLDPLENTYGLLFFSKYKLVDPEIKYMVEDDKPSVHTQVALPSGKILQFYGIHPAPPAPQHNHYTTERDKELLMVGRLARKQKIPTIVTGDLNDVAWSYTTRIFLKTSELLDPRRGRGFFNTFHAKYPLLRWPLDHLFCSPHFQLVKLHRLRYNGSDHFPLFVELMLMESEMNLHEVEKASAVERLIASKKIHTETPQ